FINLESEVGVDDAIRFSAKFMDEDEIPSEIRNQVNNKISYTRSVPIEAVEMMKYLPQELRDSLNNYGKTDATRTLKVRRLLTE
ncbi:MAG: hypothetical protein ACK53Y_04980, partial [bacterium]